MSHDHEFIELPKEAVLDNYGFSVDMGASITKLVYRAKIDRDVNYSNDKLPGRLRLAIFQQTEIDSMIAFIKEHCDIRTDFSAAPVSVTGVRTKQLIGPCKDALNIALVAEMEYSCFPRAARLLYKQDPVKFVTPLSGHVIEKGTKLGKMTADCFVGLNVQEQSPETPIASLTESGETHLSNENAFKTKEMYPDLCPCLLVTLGSAFVFTEVRADGTHNVLDVLSKGARSFMAFCKIATGETDFDKIMNMSKNGDPTKIDEIFSDLIDKPDKDDDYAKLPFDLPVFILAKVLRDNSDFEPADFIRSLLDSWAVDTAQIVQLLCSLHKFTRVYFLGNFIKSETVRTSFATAMIAPSTNGFWIHPPWGISRSNRSLYLSTLEKITFTIFKFVQLCDILLARSFQSTTFFYKVFLYIYP